MANRSRNLNRPNPCAYRIYDISLRQSSRKMTTTSLTNKKRKIIDIPNDVFRFLSIKAAAQGTNLKNYIENLLKKDMEDTVAHMNDEEAYRWLSAHEPDGLQPASPKEQEAFRKFLNQPFQD